MTDQIVGIKGMLEVEVTDNKTGAVLRCTREPMRSFVDNFAYILALILNMQWTQLHYITGATKDSLVTRWGANPAPAIAGDDTMGIVVGDDDTDVVHTQNALISKIGHGSGSGKLLYGPEVTASPTWSSTKWLLPKYRLFNNVSGGTITIYEVALYIRDFTEGLSPPTLDPLAVMLAREKPAPIALNDGQTAKISYSFQLVPGT